MAVRPVWEPAELCCRACWQTALQGQLPLSSSHLRCHCPPKKLRGGNKSGISTYWIRGRPGSLFLLTEEGAKAARTEGGFQVKKGWGWEWEGAREVKERRKGLRGLASLCGWEVVENGTLSQGSAWGVGLERGELVAGEEEAGNWLGKGCRAGVPGRLRPRSLQQLG